MTSGLTSLTSIASPAGTTIVPNTPSPAAVVVNSGVFPSFARYRKLHEKRFATAATRTPGWSLLASTVLSVCHDTMNRYRTMTVGILERGACRRPTRAMDLGTRGVD